MADLKLFLCGYHSIGCEVLAHVLARSDISEVAVFTHAAPPHVPSVEKIAKKHQIPCSLETVNARNWPFNPDVVASVYYRHLISSEVISAVDGRIFNVHPSLLPQHRGCSSVTWALIEGDQYTGITYHYIDKGVDSGNILLQAVLPIESSDTQASLYGKCMKLGMEYWPAGFELVKTGFPGVKQNGKGSVHRRGTPYDGIIDDSWSLEQTERFIRAMTHPPLPYAKYKGKEVRTFEDFLTLREGH